MKVAIYSVNEKDVLTKVFEGEVVAVFNAYANSVSKAGDTIVITVFSNIAIRQRPSYGGAIDIVKVV